MKVKKRLYTVDDVWEMQCQPGGAKNDYELISGELIEMPPANSVHTWLATELAAYIREFAKPRNSGFVFCEGAFSPENDASALLVPDMAFVHRERMPIPFPLPFFDFMPDMATEIVSPSNVRAELRRKTTIYLDNGVSLVWIVNPMNRQVKVFRAIGSGEIEHEIVGVDSVLSGEDVLPGFELQVSELLPPHIAAI